MGAIDSTKISGNFGPKLNGSVPFEVDHFSRSEFWLNGSCPTFNGYKPRIEARPQTSCCFVVLGKPLVM